MNIRNQHKFPVYITFAPSSEFKGSEKITLTIEGFFSKALKLNQPEFPQIFDIGVTAEFIHNASLLHDDVIDHGKLRRGAPTVNVVWDDLTAVLAGDILLAESIRILADCPRVVAQEALNLVSSMTKATMLEAHVRNNPNISLKQWEFIADGKTSSMFRWCGRAIGHLAKNQDATTRFGNFGTHFGLAFQLADDILDIQFSESGKTPFADLRNRNPSYPMLLACNLSAGFQKDLQDAWKKEQLSEQEIQRLGEAIISSGAVEQSLDVINNEVQQSLESLGKFVNYPGCQEIAQWAIAMCYRFQKPEAV